MNKFILVTSLVLVSQASLASDAAISNQPNTVAINKTEIVDANSSQQKQIKKP